ncbi:branched-chain amino acid ABC transporter permease [Cupriavidus basilensis]
MGVLIGLKGFAVAIMASITSARGVVITGLLYGVLEEVRGRLHQHSSTGNHRILNHDSPAACVPPRRVWQEGGDEGMTADKLRSLLFPSLVSALGVGMALLPQLVSNTYELRIWMLLTIYALVALGLNILVGLTGLVSLGQAGLFAIGAYVAAILAAKLGVGFAATIVIAMIVSSLFGALLAYPTVRVKGVYLAVITIAFGIIVENVAIEWQGVTGGTTGISAIPGPAFLGKALDDTGYFYLLAVLFLAAYVLHYNIMKSRFGRAMRAVSESEIAARSVGINPVAIRTFSFVIAAAFAGMAGGLYAYLNLYVNPDTFRFDDSVRFLLMVILGGSGTIVGPVLGGDCSDVPPGVSAGFRGVATFRLWRASRAGHVLSPAGRRRYPLASSRSASRLG